MKNDEVKLSESESLLLISSMINKAKNHYSENGLLYLLWGWLILVCCLIQFVSIHFFNYYKVYYAWYSTWILLIYQIYYFSKKRDYRNVRMYTGEIIGYVWIVFLISYALLVYILIYENAYSCICPVIISIFGMPTFLSGIILKFKPLKVGGICCWILAFLSPFTHPDYQYLLMACGVALAWIIPGHLLRRKFKKGN